MSLEEPMDKKEVKEKKTAKKQAKKLDAVEQTDAKFFNVIDKMKLKEFFIWASSWADPSRMIDEAMTWEPRFKEVGLEDIERDRMKARKEKLEQQAKDKCLDESGKSLFVFLSDDEKKEFELLQYKLGESDYNPEEEAK